MAMATALIYDEEMTKYKLLWVDPACKIEVPERLTVSHEALVRSGLAGRCVSIPVRAATDEEVLLVHSEDYLEAVKKTPYMSLEDLMTFTQQYGDVYFHPNIYHCAKLAVGASLQLVDNVMTGRLRNGMALVRPPGHHSQSSAANGFCVFNNVAIAAQYAKKHYGVQRVLIVDWDVHHGQGVQYCFEDDPSVLYFSWHRYEHRRFWPNLRESDYDSVGRERGAGFNINVPWNKVGMDNSDFLAAFFHVLLPVAYEFCPDLVLVCAGFDSAVGDPEGNMCATPDVFAHLTHLLMNLAGGKLCAVLEGGYNLTSLAQSVCQTVQTLLGDPVPQPAELGGPCGSALESVHCVRSAHRRFWSCLRHAADPPASQLSTERRKASGKENNGEEGDDEQEEETEEGRAEQVSWPEPPRRVSPPVRTAVVLPDGVACPDGSTPFGPQRSHDPPTADTHGRCIALVEKMVKNEMNRFNVLKTLLVQISRKEPEGQKSKHRIPVCLKEGCGDTAGFMQAVLGLLLPVAYEFDPGVVLLARGPDSGVEEGTWQHLTCLLQGVALGHTLVLLQENERASISPTAASLLGNPAPSLGPLGARLPDDVEALERLRRMLQAHWKLLQTTEAAWPSFCPTGTAPHTQHDPMKSRARLVQVSIKPVSFTSGRVTAAAARVDSCVLVPRLPVHAVTVGPAP
ncbi:polyamine deacetylase HDAC10 [Lampris incognitus]|uniref:polyamine deacetylase HDAC10 n=1 Tax=Lampris incognitus TaxID=2546036 RepID=UPI0024B4E751|nr:polyamine deacetylase HDAC10 [Lampris incognitus]